MSSPLSDDERAQLSARADEFHAALIRGAGSDWGPFLADLPDRMRRAVLTELVIIDLIHRWEHRERPEVEEYVARFPELGPIDKVPQQVIVEECRCRAKAGERYDVTRYRDRFPVQFPLIQKELEAIKTSTIDGAASGTVVSGAPGVVVPDQSSSFGSVAQQYEMVRPLGRGVFGEVWLARKKTSGIEKAIKIVTQSAEKEAGKRERRALELIKNLRHPYLLATEDFWVADHRLHIVMELADCTLRNRLEACREAGHPGIPEGELIGYIREAAEGLDFLHSRHVVHRDVKPDNILVLNGHAKVADFGLAWQQDKTMAPMRTFAGTPAYMAPEIWGKEGGPPSDLYALAVTYVELRQGRPPLKSQPIEEMMFAHLDGILDFEPFIGEEERTVLKKAMARMPEERHRSCMEFVDELAVAVGVSVLPRSGVVANPGSRVVPTPGSGNWKGGSKPPGGSDDRGGSVGRGTIASQQTHAGGGSGTVADSRNAPVKPTPPRPQTRRPMATLLAGVLTLALVGTLGAVIWAIVGNGSRQHADNTENGTQSGGTGSGTVGTPTKPKTTQKTNGNGTKIVPPAVILPVGAEPDPKAQVVTLADERRVYDWIVVKTAAGKEVRFRLITPRDGPRPVAPFYIMESKVWNDLFRTAINPTPESEKNGPDAPATGMTAEDAAIFVRAVFGNTARLPSPEEWDHAAGLHVVKDRDNVTRAGGQPRDRSKKPDPTHGPNSGSDINEFGLIDMAGNGREFTRAILTKPGLPPRELIEVPDPTLQPTDFVILRGRNFTHSTGLTFPTLRYEQTTPQRQLVKVGSPYTSFRVVIYVPEK
jgi:serine/threonine protein kinase